MHKFWFNKSLNVNVFWLVVLSVFGGLRQNIQIYLLSGGSQGALAFIGDDYNGIGPPLEVRYYIHF